MKLFHRNFTLLNGETRVFDPLPASHPGEFYVNEFCDVLRGHFFHGTLSDALTTYKVFKRNDSGLGVSEI